MVFNKPFEAAKDLTRHLRFQTLSPEPKTLSCNANPKLCTELKTVWGAIHTEVFQKLIKLSYSGWFRYWRNPKTRTPTHCIIPTNPLACPVNFVLCFSAAQLGVPNHKIRYPSQNARLRITRFPLPRRACSRTTYILHQSSVQISNLCLI